MLSNFAFQFNLRRYTTAQAADYTERARKRKAAEENKNN